MRDRVVPDPQAIAKTSRQLILRMAQTALDAKAEEPVILDLRKLSYSFDYFFLCSAESDRRVQAVADHLEETLDGEGIRLRHREGHPEGGWLLLDFGSIIAHIFSPEARSFYELERMWADAPQIRLPLKEAAPGASAHKISRKK